MTFLAPGLLWLLPLGLLPVVFHLVQRIRRQPRAFSSLMFFLAADPRLSARRRIREWVLLVLRCLALFALLLALARPIRRGLGRGRVALVAVVDNSASMLARGPNGETRLLRATAAAQALCEDEAVEAAGVVTTVIDPLAAMPEGLMADRTLLRAALAAIRPTQAAGNPMRAIETALTAVRGAMRQSGEVHVLTDLQAAEWQSGVAAIDLPPAVTLYLHDVGAEGDAAGTVAIASLTPPQRPPLAGRAWQAGVKLKNFGTTDGDVVLRAEVGTVDAQIRIPLTLGASEEREVAVSFDGTATGERAVHLWLEGRAAAAVADAWLLVPAWSGLDVVLANGADAYGMLSAALAPLPDGALTGIRIVETSLAGLPDRLAREPPALVVVSAAQLGDASVVEALHRLVVSGGNLLIAPDDIWPPRLPDLPVWCGVRWGEPYRDAAGSPWLVLDETHELWRELRSADGTLLWRDIAVQRAIRLLPNEATPVAGFGVDDVLLAQRQVGKGRVTVCGVAWSPQWSTLPHKAAFPALVQGIALAGAAAAAAPQIVAGAPAAELTRSSVVAERPSSAWVIEARAGDQGRWAWQPSDGRLPVRAGVYLLRSDEAVLTFTARGEMREADGRRLANAAVPQLATVPHRVIREASATSRLQAVHAQRKGRSLYAPFLLLGIAALAGAAIVETKGRGRSSRVAKR